MIWAVYNILFVIGFVALLPRFVWRMARRGGYRRHFLQRLGCYAAPVRQALGSGGFLWIQAVSVGEMYVAFRLVAEIRAVRPAARFVITTNTSTAHAVAARQIDPRDVLLYFPLDVPMVVRRVLRRVRPAAILLVENELWPNLVRVAHAQNIPVMLVNGRISEHSFRGYRRLAFFTRRLLPMVSAFCAQGRQDAERLISLGAPAGRVRVFPSAKYAVIQAEPAGEARAADYLRALGIDADRAILLGGSTWPGEEAALLDSYRDLRAQFPGLFLVLIPRHAERSAAVLAEIEQRGLSVWRKSAPGMPGQAPDVLLVDTTGEMRHFFPHAAVIFIGKSLTRHGGQNIIEPAFYRQAIVVGPHMENFPGVMEDFLSADALVQVADALALRAALRDLLADPARRAAYGARAGAVVQARAGVMADTVRHLAPWLPAN